MNYKENIEDVINTVNRQLMFVNTALSKLDQYNSLLKDEKSKSKLTEEQTAGLKDYVVSLNQRVNEEMDQVEANTKLLQENISEHLINVKKQLKEVNNE